MLRNCPTCGRLLTTPPGTPCPECLAEERSVVEKITAYLERGGSPGLASVVAGTGVPAKVIRRLVESGRIVLCGEVQAAACVLCGTALRGVAARVCPSCAAKVRGTAPPPVPPAAPPGLADRERTGGHGYHSRLYRSSGHP